ncbi:hypothetical protein FHR24_001574 [Wenyingzhuangia heitensis]|uniref:Uncharacterized protein n=1 Tax=Wenyingzhuangia heitensis TaxID=1487859 RepID=A0ABX0U8G7_9FLAO|nr:hypothetical protein [Wenyingzhuangia heitensis]NIJ45135.1 hypothetical protein [Wenyingzhuangia heitensis]
MVTLNTTNITIILSASLVVAMVIIFFLMLKNKKLKLEITDIKEKLRKIKKELELRNFRPREPRSKQILKEESVLVKNETPKIQEVAKDDVISETIELNVSSKSIDNTRTVIYLPGPFEDSKFAVEEAKDIKKENTLYKITLENKTATIGVLEILSDVDFSRALSSSKQYLETACSYKNAFSISSKKIKQVEPGKVELRGTDWVVLNKIKIEFQ